MWSKSSRKQNMYLWYGWPLGLKSRFIQTSASASFDLYSSEFKFSANFYLHSLQELLRTYSDLAIIITTPFSLPNLVVPSVKSWSRHLKLGYASPMSYENISKSFKDASTNSIILTLSLDTIIEYAVENGGSVL